MTIDHNEPMLELTDTSEGHYEDLHLKVHFGQKFVALDSRRLAVTRKEYELLTLLVKNAGELVPRDVLLARVWGYSSDIRTRTLDVHIRRLRIRLGVYSGKYIETVFGVGYRFQPIRAAWSSWAVSSAVGLNPMVTQAGVS